MSEARDLIVSLDMSDNNIAKAIGFTRLAVMQARLERTSGKRMLPKLRRLCALQRGQSVQVYNSQALSPDVAPRTETQIEQEIDQDTYREYGELAPVAIHVGKSIKGIRGKAVQKLLPDGYSVVKNNVYGDIPRIVDSIPTPVATPKRRTQHIQPTIQPSIYTYGYSTGDIVTTTTNMAATPLGLIISLVSLFFPKSMPVRIQPTHQQTHQPVNQVAAITRYVPTQQYRKRIDTTQILTLAQTAAYKPNTLGYTTAASNQPYYGDIYTIQNRYRV